MNFIKKIFLMIGFLNISWAYGQDYHFSQFYASPLSLNPALTGSFSGDYRVSLLYRNQWSGIGSKFETSTLGADINFKGGILKKDQVGAGIYMYRDNVGEFFIAQSFVLSLAYHHHLDVYKRHKISFGVQGGYVQKSIDPSRITFADQFENYKFMPGVGTGDAFITHQVNYLTLHVGAFYSFIVNPEFDFCIGVSEFQINTPKESYFTSSNRLNMRHSVYSGFNYKLTERLSVSPKLLYMNQENSQDINLGADLGYKIGVKRHTSVIAGGWFRMSDAAILMAGVKWKNYTLRGSYDATISGLKEIKNASNIKNNPKTGAFEISFIMIGKLSRAIPDTYTIPCSIY